MWTHRIKRIAGSTVVAGALLATALASHAQATTPCKAACLKHYRIVTAGCVGTNTCGVQFSMCRGDCVDPMDGSMPGPDRASCLADCRSARTSCRQAVADCKSQALHDPKSGLTACRESCNNP
jgi:hypothetical protein